MAEGVVSGQNHENLVKVKTDLKVLLECLKCHMGDVGVQQDTLLTTAALCSSSGDAKEYFRECGGINFVLNLLTSTGDIKVKIAALYTLGCACEKNVFSQKRLCTPAVFEFLYHQLISEVESGQSLKRTAAFLLLCLVTNNGEGQNLARTSHCLEELLKLFRMSSPHDMLTDSDVNHKRLHLWTTVICALCGCVNNPQNEENQLMCSSLAFPATISIVRKTGNAMIIRLVSSFLSLTIANNGTNQDRFGRLGGLEVLVNLLNTITEELLRQPDQDDIQAVAQLANVFVSCLTDCEPNHTRLVDLNLVPMLNQLLSMDFIESDVRLKIIIALGHLTEKCGRSQRQLLEGDGLSLLAHIMADNQDDEFNKAAMYLLISCVDHVSSMGGDSVIVADGPSTSMKPKWAKTGNKTLAERADTLIPVRNQQPDTRDAPNGNKAPSGPKNSEPDSHAVAKLAPAVPSTNANPASHSSMKMNETAAEEMINHLLRQLHQERNTRERLENEKKALERKDKARKMSKQEAKDKAEAITLELERQYKEQENLKTLREMQEQQKTPKCVSPVQQSLSPAMQQVQQRLKALEKSLQDISSMGNQLAEQSVQARQTDQLTNHRDDEPNSTAGRMKTSLDLPSQTVEDPKRHDEHQEVNSDQISDCVHKYLRNLKNDTDNLDKSQETKRDAPIRSSIPLGQFKVPTCPIRRQHVGVGQQNVTDPRYPPGRNVIKMRQSERSLSRQESSEEDMIYESDSESSVSDVASLSSVTDSETDTVRSLTTSDMCLMKQAQTTHHRMPSISREHKTASSYPHFSAPQSKWKLHSFQVNYSSKTQATIPLPASTQHTDPSKSGASCLGHDEESSRESKDLHQIKGVQSDSSGVSSLHSVPKCPGCAPPANRPLLNSRNFLYTLERSPHTCSEHRELHRLIKQDIQQRRVVKSSDVSPESTRSTQSHLVRNLRSASRSRRSPHSTTSAFAYKQDRQHREKTMSSTSRRRRRRQEFTQEEVQNLINGVAQKGKHWNSILWAYKFAPGRKAVDLKDKYRRMQAQNYPGVLPPSPSASLKSLKRQRNHRILDRTWRP